MPTYENLACYKIIYTFKYTVTTFLFFSRLLSIYARDHIKYAYYLSAGLMAFISFGSEFHDLLHLEAEKCSFHVLCWRLWELPIYSLFGGHRYLKVRRYYRKKRVFPYQYIYIKNLMFHLIHVQFYTQLFVKTSNKVIIACSAFFVRYQSCYSQFYHKPYKTIIEIRRMETMVENQFLRKVQLEF